MHEGEKSDGNATTGSPPHHRGDSCGHDGDGCEHGLCPCATEDLRSRRTRQRVTKAPTQIAITFSEETDPLKSGGSVTDASGATVSTGFKVDLNQRTNMTIALKPNLPNGAYTVKWNSFTDDDSGMADGTFTFTLQQAQTATTGTTTTGTAPASWPSRRGHCPRAATTAPAATATIAATHRARQQPSHPPLRARQRHQWRRAQAAARQPQHRPRRPYPKPGRVAARAAHRGRSSSSPLPSSLSPVASHSASEPRAARSAHSIRPLGARRSCPFFLRYTEIVRGTIGGTATMYFGSRSAVLSPHRRHNARRVQDAGRQTRRCRFHRPRRPT